MFVFVQFFLKRFFPLKFHPRVAKSGAGLGLSSGFPVRKFLLKGMTGRV
jgi:hypothetical protein